jgi:hypothetical protein
MPVTETDVRLLEAVARYYVLTREQIARLCQLKHASGRSTRKHLSKLLQGGYLQRHNVPVALPGSNGAAPVYYPTKAGAELLASWFDDARYVATMTRHPRADRLSHWIELNNTRIVIEQAIARQTEVKLENWISEYEIINKDATEPERFTLQTTLREIPPLPCSPDTGFLLSMSGQSKVYYVERDRNTSSPHQIAARKTRGYAEMARQQYHLRHFPSATVPAFSVLFITTNVYRCNQLAKELRKRESPELWLMVDHHDLAPESFLFEPIILKSDGQRASLIQPEPRIAGATT